MLGPLWQQYLRPASLAEALQALSAPGPACPIAGGTDLIVDLRQGHRPPVHTLVDVSAIPELTFLGECTSENGTSEIFVGAAVPHSQVIASPLINQHAQALVEACDLIGGPQVRNVATLGGNVAHALPAADGAIALLALDAAAVVASLPASSEAGALPPVGAEAFPTNLGVEITRKPLLDLYAGPGKTALKPGQLLVGFYLPLSAPGDGDRYRHGTAFQRVMRAQGVALPILNLAVWLRRKDEKVIDLRIALGPAGPVPQRALSAESILRGKPLILENITAAQHAMLAEVRFRTSPLRATAEYRRQLAGRLLAGTLNTAWERAV